VLAYQNKGFMYTSAGDLEEAVRVLKKGLDVSMDPFYNFAAMVPLCFAYIQADQMDDAKNIFLPISEFCSHAGCHYQKPTMEMFSALIQISNGELSKGMKALLASVQTAKTMGYDGLLPMQYYVIARVYLEAVKREKPVPFLTLIKNPGFILQHAPFAAKQAEKYLIKTITLGKNIGTIGIVAQAQLDLGSFYKIKKQYQEARKHLEEAIQIFDETGAYAFLKQAKAELDSIL
jgi:tetratricopeptide (TPR) repeat protein